MSLSERDPPTTSGSCRKRSGVQCSVTSTPGCENLDAGPQLCSTWLPGRPSWVCREPAAPRMHYISPRERVKVITRRVSSSQSSHAGCMAHVIVAVDGRQHPPAPAPLPTGTGTLTPGPRHDVSNVAPSLCRHNVTPRGLGAKPCGATNSDRGVSDWGSSRCSDLLQLSRILPFSI